MDVHINCGHIALLKLVIGHPVAVTQGIAVHYKFVVWVLCPEEGYSSPFFPSNIQQHLVVSLSFIH
jgi:hypothetical protein